MEQIVRNNLIVRLKIAGDRPCAGKNIAKYPFRSISILLKHPLNMIQQQRFSADKPHSITSHPKTSFLIVYHPFSNFQERTHGVALKEYKTRNVLQSLRLSLSAIIP